MMLERACKAVSLLFPRGFVLLVWCAMLFSPLSFVQQAYAAPSSENFQSYSTGSPAIPCDIGDWTLSILYPDGSVHANPNAATSVPYIDIATNTLLGGANYSAMGADLNNKFLHI